MMNVRGQQLQLDILDTAGNDEFRALLDFWIIKSYCFVLVYDIGSMQSFNYLKNVKEQILRGKE